MTLRSRERAEAAAELDATIDWYADKRKLLAVEFLDAVEAGIAHILDWPHSGHPYPGRRNAHRSSGRSGSKASPIASSISLTVTTS